WASTASSGATQIGFASVSEELARGVQHLLLRFGIVAAIRRKRVAYLDEIRWCWQVIVTHRPSLVRFAAEIGILGKDAALERLLECVRAKQSAHPGDDTIPVEVWEHLDRAKGERSWAELA